MGRLITKNKFKKIKRRIPSIREIICENHLDFTRWFKEYFFLLNCSLRKIDVKESKNYLEIEYNNFTKEGYKKFKKRFPKKYLLDEEFSYFFGLWCGDRSGGKRFGIINQNKEILDFTQKFLTKNFQDTERILYCSQNSKEPKISFDKKVIINGKSSGWAISLHSSNGILSTFFYFILGNIEFLLENYLNLNAFFAGLFDAEGNVSLYNKAFRWACKNERLIPIYSRFLKKMDLYKRYDGACLITYNKSEFFNKIVPYLKHNDKVKNATFLSKGEKKNLPSFFKEILIYVEKNPSSTQKEIAKALKKTKVYSELGLLKEFGFISSEDYPRRFKLNKEVKNISGD